MKRLERLGSVAFGTVMLSFVFHILAISYNHWKENVCFGCKDGDPLASWFTSIRERCYESSMVAIFFEPDDPIANSSHNSFITEICIPNKYLMAKSRATALDCLVASMNRSDTVCSLGTYNQDHCYCDYTVKTKVVLAFAILASFSLGIMIFLSHIISFVKIDYVLRWLIPVCFSLLSFSIFCIFIELIVAGAAINEDVNELRYSWSLVEAVVDNVTELDGWRAKLESQTEQTYTVKVGWCFGMEIIAVYFSVISLIIYALMFFAKKRPESMR